MTDNEIFQLAENFRSAILRANANGEFFRDGFIELFPRGNCGIVCNLLGRYFLEYANVYGNFYGTPRKQVMEWLDEGIDVILEIDVQGAMQVRNSYPDAVLIFILPPSLEELRNRIAGRGSETEETMKKRLGAALNEISQVVEYDYSVVNDDIDIAVDKVKSIIVSEQCRVDCENVELTVDKYKDEL